MAVFDLAEYLSPVELIGYFGTAATIATYSMGKMIPLRVAGIASSVFFLIYGFWTKSWPVVLMEATLLPINGFRLWQMIRLVRRVRAASTGDLSLKWIEPFSTRLKFAVDQNVFERDAVADQMFYILSGRYLLVEAGIEIGAGEVVGELGLLSEGNRRTGTLVCVWPGEMLALEYEEVRQLYAQNPEFGFYFLRLTSRRLLSNWQNAETRASTLVEALSGQKASADTMRNAAP